MRRLYVLLLILFASFSVTAQISVKEGSFRDAGQFFTMKEDMTDDNYTPFAVIKVKTENMTATQVEQLGFSGNALTYIDAEFHDTEVWVYLTYLAPYLKITHPDLSSTEFTIPYDMKPLQGYELVLVNGAVARTGGGNGMLTITTNVPGAEVYLDGTKMLEITPYSNDMVAAGHHELKIVKKNYQTVVRQIDVLEGKEIKIDANLELSFGIINVDTNPTGATVYIDNVKRGVTPLIINDIRVGEHALKLEKDEYDTVEWTLNVEEDKDCVVVQPLTVSKIIKSYTVKNVSFDMVLVKGGASGDFYIGRCEVTQALWKAVMGQNPSRNGGSRLPVEMVTYDDCQKFIKKLNKMTKANFRLPTRAEWEYAAKGGKWSKGYQYSGSNNINQVAWYTGNSGSYLQGRYSQERQQDYFNMTRCIHPVAELQDNELGLYDMSGNVYEFCSDIDAQGYRTAMGGSFTCEADRCKNTSSVHFKPDTKTNDLGLRLVIQY